MTQLSPAISGPTPPSAALLLPDNAKAIQLITSEFDNFDIRSGSFRILGSGQWYDAQMWLNPRLNGAWFAAPDPSAWNKFKAEFQTRYGIEPSRVATLAYDTTSLIAALVRVTGGNITAAQLTSPSGFNGVDGIFRFLPNGLNERGLSILEINNGSVSVISNAPSKF